MTAAPSPREPAAAGVPAGERLASFAVLLREHGMTVGVAEQQAMLQAATLCGVLRESVVEAAWRSIACHSHREWKLWDDVYQRFWHPEKLRGGVKVSGQTRPSRNLRQSVQDMHDQMNRDAGAASKPGANNAAPNTASDQASATGSDDNGTSPRAQGGASQSEALHQRDGQMWLPQELGALRQLARQIVAKLQPKPTRRWRCAPNGRRLDVRQTFRDSVACGGELIHPSWQVKRTQPPRLFILADVSRSMESHAALFLRVARAFALEADARVFVFHTRLAEVTPLMHRDTAAVQEKVNAVTAGFGGGTRIAASLQDFSRNHARAQINRGARVWVFSDGFDTDEPALLGQALKEVRARGARITWFHPTRQVPGAMALQRARGLIERFVPLASLADLAAARASLY
ncbi:MAG: VWA domain-containing protein [Burkholderiaceae bacterium]|nr:VWA domain-containing protein [Burkholderiaceae bacterium]